MTDGGNLTFTGLVRDVSLYSVE